MQGKDLTLKWLEGVSFDQNGEMATERRKGGNMLKIGEFSKLVQVPVPTLRYYDQVGLLKPVEVDRFTGYRYYSASQLPRLNRIRLGFSLEQIAVVLADVNSSEGSLARQRSFAALRMTKPDGLFFEMDWPNARLRISRIDSPHCIASALVRRSTRTI